MPYTLLLLDRLQTALERVWSQNLQKLQRGMLVAVELGGEGGGFAGISGEVVENENMQARVVCPFTSGVIACWTCHLPP